METNAMTWTPSQVAPATAASPAGSLPAHHPQLGREIRYCPRKRPGMVFAIVSTVLGLLALVLLIGISGEKSTKPGDLTFVAVLVSIFLGIGLLLFALRFRTIAKRIAVRVFEHGVVHESGNTRTELRFDQAQVHFSRGETTWLTTLSADDGRTVTIEAGTFDNVDNSLASFIKGRMDNPSATIAPRSPRPNAGEVVFRAGNAADPPLLGRGTLELTSAGVRMVGARARTALPMIIACVAGVLGVVVAAIIMSALDIKLEGRGSGKLAALVGLAAGIAPGILAYDLLRKHMRSRQIDVVIPWSSLLVFEHREGAVGTTVTTYELRGSMEIVAQDDDAIAALAELNRVGSRAEYGFSS